MYFVLINLDTRINEYVRLNFQSLQRKNGQWKIFAFVSFGQVSEMSFNSVPHKHSLSQPFVTGLPHYNNSSLKITWSCGYFPIVLK